MFFSWKNFLFSQRSFRSFAYNLLPVFALIFGISFVFMHNGFVFGDFLNFFSVQRSWGNNISGLFLLNNFEHAGSVYSSFRQDPFVITRMHFDMFANIILLVSSYKLWRWKYFPETIFSLACFVVNSFKPGLASASRFVIVCLPIYFVISHKKTSQFTKTLLLAGGLMLQIYFWIYFALFLSPNP